MYAYIHVKQSPPPDDTQGTKLRSFGIICEDCIDCVALPGLFSLYLCVGETASGTNVTLRRKKRLDTVGVPTTTGGGEMGWLWLLQQYLPLAQILASEVEEDVQLDTHNTIDSMFQTSREP